MYRHYMRRNITTMNFDNPVYRKTTEDQFSLDKNGFQSTRTYPSTVGEEVRSINFDLYTNQFDNSIPPYQPSDYPLV